MLSPILRIRLKVKANLKRLFGILRNFKSKYDTIKKVIVKKNTVIRITIEIILLKISFPNFYKIS